MTSAEQFVDAIVDRVIERLEKPRVLSIKHAATYLDCKEDHVRALLRAGELTALDIGLGDRRKMARIAIEELDRFLELKRRAA